MQAWLGFGRGETSNKKERENVVHNCHFSVLLGELMGSGRCLPNINHEASIVSVNPSKIFQFAPVPLRLYSSILASGIAWLKLHPLLLQFE